MSVHGPDDVRVSFPVVQLLAEIRADIAKLAASMDSRFAEIRSALDERVTNTVFESLRSDMGALMKRQREIEEMIHGDMERRRGVFSVLREFRGFVGWLVATALAAAWLYFAVHGTP